MNPLTLPWLLLRIVLVFDADMSNETNALISPQALGWRTSRKISDCLPDMIHSELRDGAKPTALAATTLFFSGMPGRLPVPPCPSVKVSLNEPWPPSAPPTAAPLRYHRTDPTPWPPTRIEVSVPGIRNERGKVPTPAAGTPGPGGGTCASWSRRCWSSSWLA